MDARIAGAPRARGRSAPRAPAGEFCARLPAADQSRRQRRIGAMEALLRWNHAERGQVPPAEFIPLAEEIGPDRADRRMGAARGLQRRRALARTRSRSRSTCRRCSSATADWSTTVTQALAAARLAPHRLELEITEAVLLQDDEAIVAMLHQLRALGVRIAMDDFGTGYSSLSYLRTFPFDKIKIDRSFIKDIERNRDSAVIVKAIASLGHEPRHRRPRPRGSRPRSSSRLVRRAGCTEMQGYLVSPPRPACGDRRHHRALPARGGCRIAASCRRHAGHRQSCANPPASADENPPRRTSNGRPCCRIRTPRRSAHR